jgi:RNA polymerase sigma-70 factor (ECF subfamily)
LGESGNVAKMMSMVRYNCVPEYETFCCALRSGLQWELFVVLIKATQILAGLVNMSNQEQVWVEQAREGDQRAFGLLVQAYQKPVFNLTYRMLGNAQEAEDAAQETFLRAYSSLRQYQTEHKFSTWLFAIANHHCIDRLRKRRVSFVSIEDNPVLENLTGEEPLPERQAVMREQSVEMQKLLQGLAPEYRLPLVLRYWEDYSYEDIATTMEITVAAVKSRLFRARQQVAKLYGEREAATMPPGTGARAAMSGPRTREAKQSVGDPIQMLTALLQA